MTRRKRLNPSLLTGAEMAGTEMAGAAGLETKSALPPIANVAGEAAATAAAQELARELGAARAEGRMVLDLPLVAVDADYLMRDRLGSDDEADEALRESLRARGQQTPIEVAETAPGRYGLISGWRRLQSLRALHEETGEARFGRVLALLRRPEHAADAYVAMIEENEIRAGLSYYERARIALRAVENGVYETEKAALLDLYRSASRTRRSKIRSFLEICRALDAELRFPRAIGERLGMALAAALAADPGMAGRLRQALRDGAPETPAQEQAILQAALRPDKNSKTSRVESDTAKKPPATNRFHLRRGSDGSLIIRGPGIDAAFVAALSDWLESRG